MLRLYWIQGASNRAYEILSNVGAPHLLVDMIPANNALYPDKERASGGHFIYGTSRKWRQRMPPSFVKSSNLHKT